MPTTPTMTEILSDIFIKGIARSLKRGKQVRRRLPCGGLVHIDRPLPFLVLFRHPTAQPDYATADFVKAEAAYIIARQEQTPELRNMIRAIARAMTDEFGAFMILEIFAAPDMAAADSPTFRVL